MQSKILRLNLAGQAIEWLDWQQAVCLYSRGLVTWTLGDIVKKVVGGNNRFTGKQSTIELPSIVACGGDQLARTRTTYPLSNPALFSRDGFICLYCAKNFEPSQLTRDHIIPTSRGGEDKWENVATACKRCNQHKANYLLEEIKMELIALPYRPNNAEYLALTNSKRILGDQMTFLRSQFSKNSRWL